MTTKLEMVFQAVCGLSKREKRELLRKLSTLPEFQEDLYDIVTYLERRDGPTRPYGEFRKELEAEGRL